MGYIFICPLKRNVMAVQKIEIERIPDDEPQFDKSQPDILLNEAHPLNLNHPE